MPGEQLDGRSTDLDPTAIGRVLRSEQMTCDDDRQHGEEIATSPKP